MRAVTIGLADPVPRVMFPHLFLKRLPFLFRKGAECMAHYVSVLKKNMAMVSDFFEIKTNGNTEPPSAGFQGCLSSAQDDKSF